MQKQWAFNRNMIGLTTLVGLLLLLVVGLVVFNASPVGSHDVTQIIKSISVSGSGEVYGKTDVAYIGLGVDQTDTNAGKVIDSANATLTAIIKVLSEAGVKDEDIQITSYSINPEDKTNPQTGQVTGDRFYHVTLGVTVTVRDIGKVGAVIQGSLAAGASSVTNLSFGIADSKSLEAEARKAAVADAAERAKQLADSTGVKLGLPISISESVFNVPVSMYHQVADNMASAPQINGGQLSVSITVSINYGIQ